MPKYRNSALSKTINPIEPKFEDEVATISYTLWMAYHYLKSNPTWLTAAILKIAMMS